MMYNKLNARLKNELLSIAEDIDIDVEELDSYYWDSNPYCVEEELTGSSGCGVWDDAEERQAQITKLIEWLESDGAGEYLTLSPDDWDSEDDNDCTTLTNECITYLSSFLS